MLNIANLHVAYGQSEVLHGLSFKVEPGEVVAIMGRNGMGKTTLMKSLMGIAPSKTGSISVGGADITKLKSFERVAKGIAYVPQGRMIFLDDDSRGKHRDGPDCFRRAARPRRSLRDVPCVARDEESAAGAIYQADSNSSWRSRGLWPQSPKCCSSMNRRRASNRRSYATWAGH